MKKQLRRFSVLILGVLLAVGAGTGAALADESSGGEAPVYLALGDSLAAGVGASDAATSGYVPQVHRHLTDALTPADAGGPSLQLQNVAVSGETSDSMIDEGQLEAAVAQLRERNGNASAEDDVRMITLNIGGNDMMALVPVCSGGPSAECVGAVEATLTSFAGNFEVILGELRGAAGASTPIIAMTYSNMLIHPDCELHSLAPVAESILEGAPALGLPAGLNDLIRAAAARHSAEVADVAGSLGPQQMQSDCCHANDAGYTIIAQEFIAASGTAGPSAPGGLPNTGSGGLAQAPSSDSWIWALPLALLAAAGAVVGIVMGVCHLFVSGRRRG